MIGVCSGIVYPTASRKEGGSNGTTRLLRSRKQCRKAGVRLDPAPAPSGQNCKGIERSTSQAAAGHELQKAAESLSHKWKEHLLLEVTPQGQSATQDFLAQSGFLGCRLKGTLCLLAIINIPGSIGCHVPNRIRRSIHIPCFPYLHLNGYLPSSTNDGS